MISILVPLYNNDCRKLARNLSTQGVAVQLPIEIIIMDDGSAADIQQANSEINGLPLIQYIVNTENQGRTKTRSALAHKAKYEWLLFLDGDSEIPDEHFLINYASALTEEHEVIAGGRNYSRNPPQDCHYILHWKYGKYRESKWRRSGYPRGFQTNNFLIDREFFLSINFPDAIVGYGHEDTWMGIELERRDISVHQIDNPVMHKQLERSEVFIKKSLVASFNLFKLTAIIPEKQLAAHVKLFRIYRILKKLSLLFIPVLLYNALKKKIEKNLLSCDPNLFFFDLYRLDHFIKISR